MAKKRQQQPPPATVLPANPELWSASSQQSYAYESSHYHQYTDRP